MSRTGQWRHRGLPPPRRDPARRHAGAGQLERATGAPLFDRRPQGLFPTGPRRGACPAPAAAPWARSTPRSLALSPRLVRSATAAQLRALIAVAEGAERHARRRHDGPRAAHPSPRHHPAGGRGGYPALRAHLPRPRSHARLRALVRAARLAFSEIAQAEADLAEFDGQGAGRITLGALPLSRGRRPARGAGRLPRPNAPRQVVTVIDGPYPELLSGLSRATSTSSSVRCAIRPRSRTWSRNGSSPTAS